MSVDVEVRARVLALTQLRSVPELDDDVEVRALLDALDRFESRRRQPLRIPVGHEGGGRFRKISDAIFALLDEWAAGDVKNPFEGQGFTREHYRKAAKERGIEVPRGASETQIQNLLLDDLRGKSGTGRKPDATTPKPTPAKKAAAPRKAAAKPDVLAATTAMLSEQVDTHGYVDVGAGVELHLGISRAKMGQAVDRLKEQGYAVHSVQVDQLTGKGKTTVKVLARPGTTYRDVDANKDKIASIVGFSEDRGHTFEPFRAPLSVDSRRLAVRYADDGGAQADGVVYVRPGVADLSLGGGRYAQVRIAVDDSHYIKGMAVYSDDLPDGVDLLFNTKKADTGNKLDALKPLKRDPETGEVDLDDPFGTSTRRQVLEDDGAGGKRVSSVMNLVYEEGAWSRWSKSLSSQVLSKQSPDLARAQLGVLRERKRRELDEILALPQPVVRRELLGEYAEGADSAAVHLSAEALPRQAWHVILPVDTLAETEVYAPGYRDGERVVLIRHPHGGTFEIPELTVNNSNPQARQLFGDARDAVGINPAVASRLSGADFDGDTVLVIPNNEGQVTTSPPLAGLADFDPIDAYPGRPGMTVMSEATEQTQMGVVSNLITDMTIQGASQEEIVRAVRHSMVVIDARKHKLDFKRSAVENDIAGLRRKYQGGVGAATLISRAESKTPVPVGKPRPAAQGGPIDPATGALVFAEPETWVDAQGKVQTKTRRTARLAATSDARTLISPANAEIEQVYAEHSNELKALANEARREMVAIGNVRWDPDAKAAHAEQVATLKAKLNIALMNAPVERHAQIIAGAIVAQKLRAAEGSMSAVELEKYRKRISAKALQEARQRVGAGKTRIAITDREWEAIQAGAVSDDMLTKILANADPARIRALTTPRPATVGDNLGVGFELKAGKAAKASGSSLPPGRGSANPVPIRELFAADDATIETVLRDVYEGEFGPYTTKVRVNITRAGTRIDAQGRERKINPSIGVSGNIYDRDGTEIGDFGRSITPVTMHYRDGRVRREIWANHKVVQLGDGEDERHQGKGFGGAFNRRAIDWYRASGIHGVSQSDHNGYVWASQGFGFSGGIVPDRVAQSLRELVADLRAGRTKNKFQETIPKKLREAPDLAAQLEAADALLARLESTKPGEPGYPTAYEFSQLGRRQGQRGKTALWLGKHLHVPADELILNPDEGEPVE